MATPVTGAISFSGTITVVPTAAPVADAIYYWTVVNMATPATGAISFSGTSTGVPTDTSVAAEAIYSSGTSTVVHFFIFIIILIIIIFVIWRRVVAVARLAKVREYISEFFSKPRTLTILSIFIILIVGLIRVRGGTFLRAFFIVHCLFLFFLLAYGSRFLGALGGKTHN